MVVAFDEITFNGGGESLMDPLITRTVDQINLERKTKNVKADLGFVDTMPLSSKETYGSVNGVNELPKLLENGTKEEIEQAVGPEKGYKIVQYGGKITSSDLFGEWLRTAKTLNGAKDDLKAEFVSQAKAAKKLMMAADKGIEVECTKVFAKGFSITAGKGPGSATAKGLPLFSASHTIYATGTTFSNLISGGVTEANLIAAIKLHIAVRLENGSRVDQPRVHGYDLYVSPDKEMDTLTILNNSSKFAATGNNASAMNQFMFDGSRVNLKVMERLGDPDRDGVTIGSSTMAFLVNTPMLKQAEALKFIRLTSPSVKQYINPETDQSVTDIKNSFAADHFGAEYFIVGFSG